MANTKSKAAGHAARRSREKKLEKLAVAFKMWERDGETDLNDEELLLMRLYRRLSRWEKNSVFLLLASVTTGHMTKKTDSYAWPRVERLLGIGSRAQGKTISL